MKKIVVVVISLFFASQLFVSCSSENEILSQFSKRKYLKKFDDKNMKQNDIINKYDNNLTDVAPEEKYATIAIEPTKIQVNETEEVVNSSKVELPTEKIEQLKHVQEAIKDYTAFNRVNRKIEFTNMETKNTDNNFDQKNNISSNKSSEVLIAILCIFLPPIGVIVYEDTVTANFWVDLLLTFIFWIPGIIFAFLVCFGGVSV